ncbi:MBL fold metallo-hydrolase [Paenibacillus nasutitermitis]|uniref:MBL fold metallo-hydrolase n=1 Tax=Paenibacillus nasutitermitis TaxID=1652958 RepID=A0A916ZGF4_9BACL|nr:MBL fold metallo-hydrolase [Paenibacillus nasutitermitis]GGD94047.1 MBL fold metallo-hydrolase [Paenibacillus nasutitermitis]
MNKPNVRSGESFIKEVKETQVPYGCLAVWYLGQESVIIKGDGITIYVDPFVSDYLEVNSGLKRTYPAPIVPTDITNADVCLITHEHGDHLDPGTIPHLAANNPDAVFIAPAACRAQMLELGVAPSSLVDAKTENWQSLQSKLRIMPVAAAHEELEADSEGNHRYVGYLIELNGVKLYHAGDTIVYPELVEHIQSQQVDLAMLPINGRDYFRTSRGIIGNMDYREAAEFAAVTGAETVIPLHYDIFTGNAENPGYFVDYLYKHFPGQKSHVLAQAERFVYVSGQAFRQT